MRELINQRLLPVFEVDLRTLALFRAALGLVLLCITLLRFQDLRAFYGDDGVMPRDWLIATDSAWRFSLHLVNGTLLFQGLLLGVAALAAFMFMLGWRTRLATILSWLLCVSIHSRNPLVLIGGDYLMVSLLFWSLFLPLGARWSVDAALSTRAPPQDHRHLSWAGAGLLLQVVSVYFFSALLKSDPVWWPTGTAVFYALSLESYATSLGHWLLNFPTLLRLLTYYVWWLELLGPILVFSPILNKPLRFVVMLMLIAMHLGFLLCLELGHFPLVSLASLTALCGGWVWDALARRDAARNPGTLRIYYDKDCDFCRKSCLLLREFLVLARAQIAPAQDTPRARALLESNNSWVVIDGDEQAYLKWAAFVALLRRSPLLSWLWPLARSAALARPGNAAYEFVARHRPRFAAVSARLFGERAVKFEVGSLAQGVCAFFVITVLIWNIGTVSPRLSPLSRHLDPLFYPLRLEQVWDMFAPAPAVDDGWYVAPGTLENGREVDVLRPAQALSFAKPERISAEYRNIRWHAYQIRNYDPRFRHHRQMWARYLCREWNREAEPGLRLKDFKLIYMLERSLPPGAGAPVIEQRVLWRHECTAPLPANEPRSDG